MADTPSELYKVYRPTSWKEVIGQSDAVENLRFHLAENTLPRAISFTGPSGTGKTTLGRIVAAKLGTNEFDFEEKNCAADFRGIDEVRGLIQLAGFPPMNGSKYRVWFLDEAHQLTKDAQSALLKVLEDTPKESYIMLGSSEPDKLIATVRGRCMEFVLKALTDEHIRQIVRDVAGKISFTCSDELLDRIVEVAKGSGRVALVLLDKVRHETDPAKQLDGIYASEFGRDSIELAKALMQPGSQWKDVAKLLKNMKEEPETIRIRVISYIAAILLNGGSSRANMIIVNMMDSFWGGGGRAKLIQACFEIVKGGK